MAHLQKDREKRQPEQEPRGADIIAGRNAVSEALRAGRTIDSLYIQRGERSGALSALVAKAKAAGAAIKEADPRKLDHLCGGANHQGVVAVAAVKEYATVEDLFQLAQERGEPPFFVLCDELEDPHNLGAILRSALLCGAHGVIIPRRGGVGVTGTVMKSSAGAAARIPVARVANLPQAIRDLKKQNIFVYCADLGGAPLEKTDLSGPVALVLGSEGAGPGALVRKLCDAAVTLDMAGGETGVDSYNVSVAAGILMYNIMQRRK